MELQKTNSESPLKKLLKLNLIVTSSKRIRCNIKDKDNFDDVFLDANDNGEADETKSILKREIRRKSIKEIQDCDTKMKLKDYINEKKRKLDQSRRILELKYEKYKKCDDFLEYRHYNPFFTINFY